MRSLFFTLLLVACESDAASSDGVLVELFTSEGCSSCPPADANLADAVANDPDGRLIALSWHVDYWDDLGWKDPFSSAEATARQHRYAQRVSPGRVYTPQMVVNSLSEFTGSSRKGLAGALEASHSWAVSVSLAATRAADAVDVTFSTSGPTEGLEVLVVLTQDRVVRSVTSGENRGRTLSHDFVVRATATAAPSATHTRLVVPGDIGADEPLTVVALVQEPDVLVVAGAARAPVRPAR